TLSPLRLYCPPLPSFQPHSRLGTSRHAPRTSRSGTPSAASQNSRDSHAPSGANPPAFFPAAASPHPARPAPSRAVPRPHLETPPLQAAAISTATGAVRIPNNAQDDASTLKEDPTSPALRA